MSGEASTPVGGGSTSNAGGPAGGGTSSAAGGNAPASAGNNVPASAPGAPPSTGAPNPTTPEGTSTPETPAEKKYKVRVGKKEQEVSRSQILEALEAEIGEDGLLDLYRLRRGSFDRFEEAKKTQSKAAQMEKLLSDPRAVFAELARRHGPDKAASLIEQQYKEIDAFRKMTPQQRQAWMQRKQLEADKQEVDAYKARMEAETRAKRNEQNAQVLQGKFSEALTAAGVPVNQASIARMAIHAKELSKKGVPVTYGAVAKQVREDIQNELRTVFKGMKREQIRDYLGDELVQYIRGLEIAALEGQGPQASSQARGPDGKFVPVKGNLGIPKEQPKKVPIHEWRKQQIEARRRG